MPDVGDNITASVSRHFSSPHCVLIAVWFGISATAAAWPQRAFGGTSFSVQERAPSQSGGPVLRSEVDLQTVNVQVKDKQGNSVLGLAAHDFTVRENGKPQKIAFFDAGNGPVTVAVLVDSSSSMVSEGQLGSALQIAARFMRIARPGDDIYAMDFTEWTGPFERLTAASNCGIPGRSPYRLRGVGHGGVRCHCHSDMSSAYSKNPSQAIIVITDAVDEHSRLTLDQLIDLVRAQRAQLF